MSLSPATTCALVTTSPGEPTQPLPSIPRPQAVPTTLTTLVRAVMTPRLARIPRRGGGTSAAGPRTDGSGSNRDSALRIGPDGGSSWLSPRRIAERWMSARRLSEPDDCTAIAPMIHAIPSPTHAVSTAPSIPSTVRSPGNRSSERA